jgi:hypothetical protein
MICLALQQLRTVISLYDGLLYRDLSLPISWPMKLVLDLSYPLCNDYALVLLAKNQILATFPNVSKTIACEDTLSLGLIRVGMHVLVLFSVFSESLHIGHDEPSQYLLPQTLVVFERENHTSFHSISSSFVVGMMSRLSLISKLLEAGSMQSLLYRILLQTGTLPEHFYLAT